MRIFAVIFTCTVLLGAISAQAQATPAGPAPDKPCAVLPNAVDYGDGILSDTAGVDFHPYLGQIMRIVQSSWNPLIPREAVPPFNKSGEVVICFKILPNGRLMDGAMVLGGRSGDEALDRAAWGSLETSVFPPLPAEFKGPYLALRVLFMYNMDRKPAHSRKMPKPRNLPGPLGLTFGYSGKV